ncbi:hypothetical protein OL239_06680 [Arthrobacter sp. ATA002]|uniref:hypothetical protein n=1 Tax=Arthrobacter sp. ATA002 TaxID=2991715 RepID=UPI0022A7FB81|nr:hypothetical protein [Arthrobacter sp. ATA002]WAP53468.1 hypothetical protein OL239_06680 [Arthrobacter sp. ATA002]
MGLAGLGVPAVRERQEKSGFQPRTGFYFFTGYGREPSMLFLSEEPKLSGKSPQGSNAKKPGKSIKEKRAEKKAKNSSDSELMPRKRKGQ